MKADSIRIAGAGLSGLSAAICLARHGHRVEVFEKNAESGQTRATTLSSEAAWWHLRGRRPRSSRSRTRRAASDERRGARAHREPLERYAGSIYAERARQRLAE